MVSFFAAAAASCGFGRFFPTGPVAVSGDNLASSGVSAGL